MAENSILPLKVLLVEDELINRRLLGRILGKLVESVRVTEDGINALEVMKDFKPDILITDLSMPRMDGLTLIKELLSRGMGVPTIILSAHNELAIVEEASSIPHCRFLFKPINLDLLIEALMDIHHQLQRSPGNPT